MQLIPAFMLSELRVAFQIGFVIFLPFLLIDLIVSSVLMGLGMMMMPPVTVSLPIKILPVSYTHLDVYKRQPSGWPWAKYRTCTKS